MNCLGKTVAAELAMLRVFRERPDAACVYIGPLKALVRERMRDCLLYTSPSPRD